METQHWSRRTVPPIRSCSSFTATFPMAASSSSISTVSALSPLGEGKTFPCGVLLPLTCACFPVNTCESVEENLPDQSLFHLMPVFPVTLLLNDTFTVSHFIKPCFAVTGMHSKRMGNETLKWKPLNYIGACHRCLLRLSW